MEEEERDSSGDVFLSYREEIEGYAQEAGCKVVCVRRPVKDLGVPSRGQMETILYEIDSAIAGDRPVYVHCRGGKGRTGTVIGCYLARHVRAGGEMVMEVIKRLRMRDPEAASPSPETAGQREMVRSWSIGE